MKHHKSVKMYRPTIQCTIKTYYQMLQLSAYVPNLCPHPKSSLISHSINDLLLAPPMGDCLVVVVGLMGSKDFGDSAL